MLFIPSLERIGKPCPAYGLLFLPGGRRSLRRKGPWKDRGKKKIRAFSEYIPGAGLDAHAVVAEFIRQQEMLLVCIGCARRADLNGTRIPVSIARWLTLKLGDVLQFMVMHDERHIRQAKSVVKLPYFQM